MMYDVHFFAFAFVFRSSYHCLIFKISLGGLNRTLFFLDSCSFSIFLVFPIFFFKAHYSPVHIGTPFLNLCTSKTASLWFNQEQTAMANSIMSLSIPVGFMLAYCLGTLIVTSASQAQFLQLTTLYSVITLIGTFMVTVFFKYPHGTVVKNGHFCLKSKMSKLAYF